ncbi:MAG: DegT/DnrJ/EryC1/StrS family aminotransferase [Candidatus Bathyarchaeia archaeon]
MNREAIIRSAFPFFDDETILSILKDLEVTLKSGALSNGPHVKDFENKFAECVQVKHAVSVNSGTTALEIALRCFKIKGREVIVPTNTFVATPNSVIFAGGKPVFADIKEDTLCIDPEDVEKKLSPRTAGIIVVHIAGLICPQVDELVKLCEDNGIFLLEDAAHAHGAKIDQRMAGALGNAGCFSFAPTKVLTSGEGGMITTNDSYFAESARCMRTHGLNLQGQMIMLGHNWHLSEIAAIIGKHQLEHLEQFINKRNEIVKYYEHMLRNIPGVSIFKKPSNIRHSYHKYPIKLEKNINREKVANLLRKEYGIETGNVYYPPCHLHPFYMQNFGTKEGDLPVAENVLKRVLCLPIHLGLTGKNVKYISEALAHVMQLC